MRKKSYASWLVSPQFLDRCPVARLDYVVFSDALDVLSLVEHAQIRRWRGWI